MPLPAILASKQRFVAPQIDGVDGGNRDVLRVARIAIVARRVAGLRHDDEILVVGMVCVVGVAHRARSRGFLARRLGGGGR